MTILLRTFLVIALSVSASAGCGASPSSESEPTTFVAAKLTAIQPPAPIYKMPNYSGIADVVEKKTAFFSLVGPLIDWENAQLLQKRSALLLLLSKETLSGSEQQWLMTLATDYRLSDFDRNNAQQREALLRRVDIVPRELALVQAANESGWGTSRFAQQANNLFGQWCFSAGCGVVPVRRSAGGAHEVAKFKTVNASVHSYVHNLNVHSAYSDMRVMRAQLRQRKAPISATVLAAGLESYSERGDAYIKEIRAMIRHNELLMTVRGSKPKG